MRNEYNPFGPGSKKELYKQWADVETEKQEALARIRAIKAELELKKAKERKWERK